MGAFYSGNASGTDITTPLAVTVALKNVTETPTSVGLWLVTVFGTVTPSSNHAIAVANDLPVIRFDISGMDDTAADDWVLTGLGGASQFHCFSALLSLSNPTANLIATISNRNNAPTSAATVSVSATQIGDVPDATTTAANVTVTPGSQHQVSRQQVRP